MNKKTVIHNLKTAKYYSKKDITRFTCPNCNNEVDFDGEIYSGNEVECDYCNEIICIGEVIVE